MFETSLSTTTVVVVGIKWSTTTTVVVGMERVTTTTVVVGIERVTTTTVVVGIKWVKYYIDELHHGCRCRKLSWTLRVS